MGPAGWAVSSPSSGTDLDDGFNESAFILVKANSRKRNVKKKHFFLITRDRQKVSF
jgi:hypothetical protein